MAHLLLQPNKPKAVAASRRHRKRRLAIRAMAAQTAWLEGRLRWHNGRVAWEDGNRLFVPGPADIALTQRRLGQIGGSRVAARLTLGDNFAGWLDHHFALLTLAKQLHALSAPDLPALVQQSPYHASPETIKRLVELLSAEVLCLGGLPASPSLTLLNYGEKAAPHLRGLVEQDAAPMAGRAMAAMVLGAIQAKDAGWPPAIANLGQSDNWLRRTYNWGLQNGLPTEAALIVALLEDAKGSQLARRYRAVASNEANPFRLPAEWLREQLARGVGSAQLIALAEATAEGEALAERILNCHDVVLDPIFDKSLEGLKLKPHGRLRRVKLVELRQKVSLQRHAFLISLAQLLPKYLAASPKPEVISYFYRFTNAMLDLGPLTIELASATLQALNCGLELEPELQYPFLKLLVEQHTSLWDRERLGKVEDNILIFNEVWLNYYHKTKVVHVQKLLRDIKDGETVRKIIETRYCMDGLYWSKLPNPNLYEMWIDILRGTLPYYPDNLPRNLLDALSRFPTAQAARVVFKPLLTALTTIQGTERGFLLELLLEDLTLTRRNLSESLPRLARHVPVMAAYMLKCPDDAWLVRLMAAGIVLLDKVLPDATEAKTWVEWVFKLIEELVSDPKKSAHFQSYQLTEAITLAYHLSNGNLATFQTCFKVAIRQDLNHKFDLLQAGLDALSAYPRLRTAMGQVLPQEFKRCVRLLALLGLAARLGSAVLTPLEALEPLEQTNPGGSKDLLGGPSLAVFEESPELLPALLVYLQARQLCGLSLQLPAGVRQTLELPAKLAKELVHLEQRVITDPRPELLSRVTNLRARLEARTRLLEEVTHEASKKLGLAAAQAHLAAAEQQLTKCYHTRLKNLVGNLSPDLEIDEDLLNATLLSSDISQNRRLLLRLLRAYLVEGQTDWPLRQKANQRFLKELGEHSVNVEVWLDTRPCNYTSDKIAGGTVHLKLERDPLHILQMGNYFDTCLSFGGVNAFSTVANACELNKRVIYATDSAGRVIGRKLIGINDEWQLVGFRNYTALQSTAANEALHDIFRKYCTEFAAECGLPLGESSQIPTLLAESWYNDGSVSWEEKESSSSK